MTNPELDPKEKVAIEAMIQKEVDYEFNRIVLELENYRETEVDMGNLTIHNHVRTITTK